jgi:Ca-activated chloride channel homolog
MFKHRTLRRRRYRCCRLLALVLSLGMVVPASPAQVFREPAISSGELETTVFKEVQEVSVAFIVTDKHGRFVYDLTPSELLILDNNEPADRITFFESQANLPLRMALVIDASDSVTHCLDSERKTATEFLKRNLRQEQDTALVITFNENSRIVQPATNNLMLLRDSLRRIDTGGETAIYDAVYTASQELGKIRDAQPTRHMLVLITDGEDNHSHFTLQQAIDTALRNDAAVYVVSTNPPDGNTEEEKRGDEAMKRLSNSTGGSFLRANGNVADAFLKIEKQIRAQYAIGYKPPNTTPNGQFHQLTILGPKKLRLFHRVGYFAK